jgi:cytochrome P450
MCRELRARCPVAHSDAYGGFWTVTRWADIERVVTHPEESLVVWPTEVH